LVLIGVQMWMWDFQFFTFLNTGRYEFLYDILTFTRRRRCSGLMRYGILCDIYSVTTRRQCNGSLVEFALSEYSYYYLRQRRRYLFLPMFVCLSVC